MTKQNSKIAKIIAVCVSKEKGTKKTNVFSVRLKKDFGIIGDAHGGSQRQVSLLAEESIEKMKAKGLAVNFGDFAENIVTSGIDLKGLALGSKIKLGEKVVLEITQIGKECHSPCHIYYKTGDCIMPREGVFAKVLRGGKVKVGDKIFVES